MILSRKLYRLIIQDSLFLDLAVGMPTCLVSSEILDEDAGVTTCEEKRTTPQEFQCIHILWWTKS
jgi:hypothetical protein